jgi:hypothetical protein
MTVEQLRAAIRACAVIGEYTQAHDIALMLPGVVCTHCAKDLDRNDLATTTVTLRERHIDAWGLVCLACVPLLVRTAANRVSGRTAVRNELDELK